MKRTLVDFEGTVNFLLLFVNRLIFIISFSFQETKAIWTKAGQDQVFTGEYGLTEEEREALYLDLAVPTVDFFL